MSDGEYEQLAAATTKYSNEVAAFGKQLGGKCAVLASVGELAAFSDCVKDGYKGVDDGYAYAEGTYQDLTKATAKTCNVRVKLLDRRIRQVQGTLSALHDQAENLQLTVAGSVVAARYLTQRNERFALAYARALSSCRPS